MTASPQLRTAVVTGAASGIGASCCAELLAHGWQVHGWDLRSGDDDSVQWHEVDVADYGSVSAAAAALSTVDLLVNCAGIGGGGPTETIDPELFARVQAVNVNGTFHTTRALGDALGADGGGTVVNIASIVAHRPGPRRAPYATSKAAVLALTAVQATDLAQYGVRVVAVSPGYTDTPMVARSLASGALDRDAILDRTPAGRLVDPAELAGVIRRLSDPAFALIAGSAVVVDGGWLANGAY